MKKLTIISSLFSILAGIMLSACAHDEPVTTQTSTTTRETTVQQPAAATRTTTTRSSNY
jgi:uncharacterized lipoprotein YajG